MISMTETGVFVLGGINAHNELHMAAVVEEDDGTLLETKMFSTTPSRTPISQFFHNRGFVRIREPN